jgi:hypothetical protein
MFLILLLDHRLAFVFLAALILAAGAPLAFAWARLLPDEPPPFTSKHGPPPQITIYKTEDAPPPRDAFAVFLLACATLSYILRFPGMPGDAALRWLATILPAAYVNWIVLGGRAFLVVMPGLAACYSVVRPNPIRVPLIVGGILVLLFWLLFPFLHSALVAL